MTERNDREMIQSPLKWPMCDYLCMKKIDKDKNVLDHGRLKTGSTRHVWANPDDGGHLIEEYDDLDALLEDGWIVD
jgi:hypothetical protein